VPFPPGGSTTIIARLVGQRLTESWGQQVVVDNRGGGNTIIGSEGLVRPAPNGYGKTGEAKFLGKLRADTTASKLEKLSPFFWTWSVARAAANLRSSPRSKTPL
jgi:tripartite-type tricarboxylate transporter receptor subunit TctC